MDKDTLQLSVIRTGSASAKRTFVVSGGSLVQSADVAHVVVYIKHSKVNCLKESFKKSQGKLLL